MFVETATRIFRNAYHYDLEGPPPLSYLRAHALLALFMFALSSYIAYEEQEKVSLAVAIYLALLALFIAAWPSGAVASPRARHKLLFLQGAFVVAGGLIWLPWEIVTLPSSTGRFRYMPGFTSLVFAHGAWLAVRFGPWAERITKSRGRRITRSALALGIVMDAALGVAFVRHLLAND
jgi:hypothetical protein